jgi:hypothetical protein
MLAGPMQSAGIALRRHPAWQTWVDRQLHQATPKAALSAQAQAQAQAQQPSGAPALRPSSPPAGQRRAGLGLRPQARCRANDAANPCALGADIDFTTANDEQATIVEVDLLRPQGGPDRAFATNPRVIRKCRNRMSSLASQK